MSGRHSDSIRRSLGEVFPFNDRGCALGTCLAKPVLDNFVGRIKGYGEHAHKRKYKLYEVIPGSNTHTRARTQIF